MATKRGGTSSRNASDADRRDARLPKALALRLKGLSYHAIGERMGTSRPTAFKDVRLALQGIATETREKALELRAMELQRCDALQAAAWAGAMRGNPDKIRTILRVMDRRARLLGLDAPTLIGTMDPSASKGALRSLSDTTLAQVAQDLTEARLATPADDA